MSEPAPMFVPPKGETSFWPVFAKVLAFILMAGVVGPIFLMIGLINREPETDWAIVIGGLVTAFDIGLAVYIAFGVTKQERRRKVLAAHGVEAKADVLGVEPTGRAINGRPVVNVILKVHGPDVSPFEVVKKVLLPGASWPSISRGLVTVVLDPETREMEIDWGKSLELASPARPDGVPPIADRLAELDQLLRQDLVSREEYDATRRKILDEV